MENAVDVSSSPAVALVIVSSKLWASELLSISEGLGSSGCHISYPAQGSHMTSPEVCGLSTAENDNGGFTR